MECDDHAVLFTNSNVTFVSVMQMTDICLTCGLAISIDDLQAHMDFCKVALYPKCRGIMTMHKSTSFV